VSLRLSSAYRRYWNVHQLSITYDFRPRLRSRLTLGGLTFPRKPWAFGGKVSRFALATHTGILSCIRSTTPHGMASMQIQCSPTQYLRIAAASVTGLSPGHFRRRITRPVSCYALFECVAASKPTSWLSVQSHILFHLTCTLGP
jgi:hypothetical protein